MWNEELEGGGEREEGGRRGRRVGMGLVVGSEARFGGEMRADSEGVSEEASGSWLKISRLRRFWNIS